jgi:hypothetical protein
MTSILRVVLLSLVLGAVIDLGFRPRRWQAARLAALRRFNVIVAHRQSGKTELVLAKLVDDALRSTRPFARFGYVAPFLKQAKAVAWDRLKAHARMIPGTIINESDLSVEFPNGARIRLFGADNPDSLRGMVFEGLVVDEVSDHARRVWGEILLPTLAARQGWAIFVGTPRGLSLLSDLYYGRQQDPEWCIAKVDVHESGVFTEEEIAALQRQCTPSQWAQEFLVDFNASSDFLTIDALTAVTIPDRTELRPRPGVQYHAVADFASGIAGGDPAALAIGHAEVRDGASVCVIDLVREVRPPFSVATVTKEFARVCRSFDVLLVIGDRFGSTFAEHAMQDVGLTLWPADRTKSDFYVELAATVNARRIELLDLPVLRTQLAGLHRRVGRNGREYIDDGGEHDDVANVVAGVALEVLQPAAVAGGIGQAITDDADGDLVPAPSGAPSWMDFMRGVRTSPGIAKDASGQRSVGKARTQSDPYDDPRQSGGRR